MKQFTIKHIFLFLLISFSVVVITFFLNRGQSVGDMAFAFFNVAFQVIFNLILLAIIPKKGNWIKILIFILINAFFTWIFVKGLILEATKIS